MSIDNKVILLTGGSGSFGQKFAEIVLREHNPKAIRVFSRGEQLQYEMQQKFNNNASLRFFIGDVRDRDRVYRATEGADIVVHAAALKQVPTCEYNPIEAIRTNIDGAINIIDAAIDNSVEKVIAISTDKAVHPVNLYGATKMNMERLFTQANVYTGTKKTHLSCTRYGNVVGSRGSVVPLFLNQRQNGKITITNDQMTRFWITLEQGVRFVINCIDKMHGGEIFIPKIPSMKITDLANAIAPDAEKEITGIRPGEKLHEVLITEDEARHTKEFDDYYIVEPEQSFWAENTTEGCTSVLEGFRYASNTNNQWLTNEELIKIIQGL